VLQAFPDARIVEIRTPEAVQRAAATEALPEVEDEWDPFEDD
jgi:DNA polymerase-3 subunit gamma/tau